MSDAPALPTPHSGRVLLITRAFPDATGTGGEQRTWNHLLALLHFERVDVLLPVHRPLPDELLEAVLESTAAVSARIGWVRAVRGEPAVDFEHTYRMLPDREGVETLRSVDLADYDLVLGFRTFAQVLMDDHMAPSDPDRLPPVVIDFDDVESVAIWREMRQNFPTNGWVQSFRMALRALHRYRLERAVQRGADTVLICSATDKARLLGRGRSNIAVVPNSVPVPAAPLPVAESPGDLRILFAGALFYPPNVDAITWLVEEVMPLVLEQLPTAHLDVVGRRPPPSMQHLCAAAAGVTLTPDVPSMEPWYAQASIVAAPIRFGGGTRIKILEALAMGRALVTTTMSAEGIDIRPHEHALFADDAQGLADHILALAEDEPRRVALGARGHARMLELYAAPQVQTQEAAILAERIARRSAERSER